MKKWFKRLFKKFKKKKRELTSRPYIVFEKKNLNILVGKMGYSIRFFDKRGYIKFYPHPIGETDSVTPSKVCLESLETKEVG